MGHYSVTTKTRGHQKTNAELYSILYQRFTRHSVLLLLFLKFLIVIQLFAEGRALVLQQGFHGVRLDLHHEMQGHASASVVPASDGFHSPCSQ